MSDEFLRVHSAVRRVRFVAITSSKGMHEYGSASPPSFFHSSAIARCADYIRNGCSCAILSYGGCLHALTQVSISCGCSFWTACRSVVAAATFS